MATKAQLEANARYRKKAYDQLSIRIPKGERERFTEYASEQGISLAEYVRCACYRASGKGTMTQSVAYVGWIVRTYESWIIAERINSGEEGWLAVPITADHMAVFASIEEEWGAARFERTEEALEAIKSWDPIRHSSRPGFASYQDENGQAYFEDECYKYKTKELINPYLVGVDDDGSYYYFRDGLGYDPMDLLDLVIGNSEDI